MKVLKWHVQVGRSLRRKAVKHGKMISESEDVLAVISEQLLSIRVENWFQGVSWRGSCLRKIGIQPSLEEPEGATTVARNHLVDKGN